MRNEDKQYFKNLEDENCDICKKHANDCKCFIYEGFESALSFAEELGMNVDMLENELVERYGKKSCTVIDYLEEACLEFIEKQGYIVRELI